MPTRKESTGTNDSAPQRMLFGVPRKPTGFVDIVMPDGSTASYAIPDHLSLSVEHRIRLENAQRDVLGATGDTASDREKATIAAAREFLAAAVPDMPVTALDHLSARDLIEMYGFVLRVGSTAGAREEAAPQQDPPSPRKAASGGTA